MVSVSCRLPTSSWLDFGNSHFPNIFQYVTILAHCWGQWQRAQGQTRWQFSRSWGSSVLADTPLPAPRQTSAGVLILLSGGRTQGHDLTPRSFGFLIHKTGKTIPTLEERGTFGRKQNAWLAECRGKHSSVTIYNVYIWRVLYFLFCNVVKVSDYKQGIHYEKVTKVRF